MSTASDLTKRIDNFDQFLDERMPVLYEFAQSLRLPAPHAILTDPMSVLSGISAWLALQTLSKKIELGFFLVSVTTLASFSLLIIPEHG